MKDFIISLLSALIILLGGAFLLKGKIKNPFKNKNKNEIIIPPPLKLLPKEPDIEKIREEFKNETPKESSHRITDLLNELFPRD